MIYRFNPIFKAAPWGGARILEMKGLPASTEPIGESWEISAVSGMESVVADGEERGLTLRELIDRHGAALLGDRAYAAYGGEFPLLVKFLHARQWLSLQVHPDDIIVKELEPGASQGKNEMWHIIDAAPGSQLIAGFKPGVTFADYLRVEGSIELLNLVERYEAAAGREFFLESGIIHALGPGSLIAEVQQSCDFTYRVYDYGRQRPLHLEKARRSLKFDDAHCVNEPLDCFQARSYRTEGLPVEILPVEGSFVVLMILKGKGEVDGVAVRSGTTLLISADHGVATLRPLKNSKVSYLTVAV